MTFNSRPKSYRLELIEELRNLNIRVGSSQTCQVTFLLIDLKEEDKETLRDEIQEAWICRSDMVDGNVGELFW